MTIEAVELRRLRMPLMAPFRTSSAVVTARDVLLLRVRTPDADGWGECVAMETPSYTSEYVEGAADVLRTFLAPAVIAGAGLGEIKGHRMAKAALETAMLDASLQAAGVSFASYLGATRPSVDAGVSVGIASSIGALLDTVAGYLDEGYRRVKLKIEPGWDVEPVRAVRERFGHIPLQVDANCAYPPDEFPDLDGYELVLIEQPFAAGDLLAHARLARRISTPVCLDESVGSALDAAVAIELGACSVINVKPGRVGGYLEARRVHDVCVAAGVPVWCGGMLETGIGRAGNVALAALPGFTLPGDVSASNRYFEQDITPPFVLVDGRLDVPTGPGLGVTPLPEVLASVTTSIEEIRA